MDSWWTTTWAQQRLACGLKANRFTQFGAAAFGRHANTAFQSPHFAVSVVVSSNPMHGRSSRRRASAGPNPSLHPKCHSAPRLLPHSRELKRWASDGETT